MEKGKMKNGRRPCTSRGERDEKKQNKFLPEISPPWSHSKVWPDGFNFSKWHTLQTDKKKRMRAKRKWY